MDMVRSVVESLVSALTRSNTKPTRHRVSSCEDSSYSHLQISRRTIDFPFHFMQRTRRDAGTAASSLQRLLPSSFVVRPEVCLLPRGNVGGVSSSDSSASEKSRASSSMWTTARYLKRPAAFPSAACPTEGIARWECLRGWRFWGKRVQGIGYR